MNARAPLRISTPDGSGQAVHPDVIHIPEGFAGYEYWFAFTPYPFGAAKLENPCVRASHDGLTWNLPPGAPDPVVPAPDGFGRHHADTELAYWDNRLHLIFMTTTMGEARSIFSVASTTDGRSWTRPCVLLADDWIVSPCLLANEGGWRLWYIQCHAREAKPRGRLLRRTGANLKSLGEAELCRLEIPGHTLWHIDIIETPSGYEGLATTFPHGADPTRTQLFHVASSDGLDFRLTSPRPLLAPSRFGWDNRFIYRSSFLLENGRYRIWYSAASWELRCGIGYLTGALTDLADSGASAEIYATNSPAIPRLASEAFGLLKYAIIRTLPELAITILMAVRNRLRNRI